MEQQAFDPVEDRKLSSLGEHLSPNNPIRSSELLRGRDAELDALDKELRHFKAIPFIYGDRGVGKTSLARTVAQKVTAADREHVYVACARGVSLLAVLKEVAEGLLHIGIKTGGIKTTKGKWELNLSLNPSFKLTSETTSPVVSTFTDASEAIRAIRDLDRVLPDARRTVVIIDELEVLEDADRLVLAHLVKQIGDQEMGVRFILVGIGENVSQLIGAHQSAGRYIKEVNLTSLTPQVLMDIVSDAAESIAVTVDREILLRIAIIGNGYPHFAHLMGKAILVECVRSGSDVVTPDIFDRAVAQAVSDSKQELKSVYDAATRRGGDVYKHLVWALADKDVVDVRIDEWIAAYHDLVQRLPTRPDAVEEKQLRIIISRLSRTEYGSIVTNTPKLYGRRETVYRFKRFSETLMRGHVRLQAANEKVFLGRTAGL